MNATRILIVDDSTTNNILLQSILEEEGFHVDVAFSGKEALTLVNKQTPSLILLDIMMPEIDGISLLRQLQANAQTQAIPVVMVTAKDDEYSREESILAGAKDFLTKPIDVDLVIQKVKSLVN
ncbi:MAG: response regulator [Bacteroidales bacterium]